DQLAIPQRPGAPDRRPARGKVEIGEGDLARVQTEPRTKTGRPVVTVSVHPQLAAERVAVATNARVTRASRRRSLGRSGRSTTFTMAERSRRGLSIAPVRSPDPCEAPVISSGPRATGPRVVQSSLILRSSLPPIRPAPLMVATPPLRLARCSV